MKPLLIAVVPVRVLVLWFSVDALIGPVVWGLYSVGPASSTTHPMLSLTFPIIYKQTISVGYSYNFRKCPIVCSWVNPLYGTNSDSDKLVQTQTVTNLYKHRQWQTCTNTDIELEGTTSFKVSTHPADHMVLSKQRKYITDFKSGIFMHLTLYIIVKQDLKGFVHINMYTI